MRLVGVFVSAATVLFLAAPAMSQGSQVSWKDLDRDSEVTSQCICDIATDIVGLVFSDKPGALDDLKRGSTFYTQPMGGRSCAHICRQLISDPDRLTYGIRARITRAGCWAAGEDYFFVDGAVIEPFGPFRMD